MHKPAIMQDFRDNQKKELNGHFGFYNCETCHDFPFVRHYILFYIHGPAI